MPITTKDCKDFILSISSVINTSINDKWKRLLKYKNEQYVLRDFENQDGRILTVGEDNGNLFLYYLSQAIVVEEDIYDGQPGILYVGAKATEEDILSFMAQCAKNDSQFTFKEDGEYPDHEDAIIPSSWSINDRGFSSDLPDNHHFNLCYSVDSPIELHMSDIHKVYSVWMPKYDTTYRFIVYETNDNYLVLGKNNPD